MLIRYLTEIPCYGKLTHRSMKNVSYRCVTLWTLFIKEGEGDVAMT